jgi:hypothetical protein
MEKFMKPTEFTRVREGEDPRSENISCNEDHIKNILQHFNQFSHPWQQKEKKLEPVSYTDGIASSSGLSGSERITPPDVEEVLQSRRGRTLGQEISLAYTQPGFLQKGRGGTLGQAIDYWEKIPDADYIDETYHEIANMSKEDGRRRLNEIFGERSPQKSPQKSPERASKSGGERETRMAMIHQLVDRTYNSYITSSSERASKSTHPIKNEKLNEVEFNALVEYLDKKYTLEDYAREELIERLRKCRIREWRSKPIAWTPKEAVSVEPHYKSDSDQDKRMEIIHQLVDQIHKNHRESKRTYIRETKDTTENKKLSKIEFKAAVKYLDTKYAPERGNGTSREHMVKSISKYQKKPWFTCPGSAQRDDQ